MTGRAEFKEVFLSDVRVPDEQRIGEVGAGWAVVMSTLQSERMFTPAVDDEAYARDDLVAAFERAGRPTSRRLDVVDAKMSVRTNELTALRAAEAVRRSTPGPDATMIKVRVNESTQAATELAIDVSGADGTLYPSGYELGQPSSVSVADLDPHQRFLNARGGTIAAGTSQIMRNVLAERVRGLPREPRNDTGIPWRDVPRGGTRHERRRADDRRVAVGDRCLARPRRVDVSSGIAGGACTKVLADAGADVIKVEDASGDDLRRYAHGRDQEGDSILFRYLAGSKRSVVLDSSPSSQERFARLVDAADVIVWSPGSSIADASRASPEAVRAMNQRAVVCAISPFGRSGPWSGRPATDLTLQAWSGGIGYRGMPDREPV